MNIRQLKNQWVDYLNILYLEQTAALTAEDLKNTDLMFAAYARSYSEPTEYVLTPTETTDFYGKSSLPIEFSSISFKQGKIYIKVTGKDTKRIRKKWARKFNELVGSRFEDVIMEFVQ